MSLDLARRRFLYQSLTGVGGLALADVMHRAWVAFATGGAPGWSPYDIRARRVMRFHGAGGTVVVDPASDERRLWDGIR